MCLFFPQIIRRRIVSSLPVQWRAGRIRKLGQHSHFSVGHPFCLLNRCASLLLNLAKMTCSKWITPVCVIIEHLASSQCICFREAWFHLRIIRLYSPLTVETFLSYTFCRYLILIICLGVRDRSRTAFLTTEASVTGWTFKAHLWRKVDSFIYNSRIKSPFFDWKLRSFESALFSAVYFGGNAFFISRCFYLADARTSCGIEHRRIEHFEIPLI